ncbi:MAG: 4Fe-4S dicluster domain-containing protein, partial [Clostridiales bacterium]
MRIVTFDPNKCVACRNCEYACAYQHKQDFKRADAQIRVSFYPEERVCIPLTCIHCADAWCLNVCPAGAISRNPQTGAVEIDQKKCKGCKMCMLACPYGNIHFDEEKM